MDCAPLRTILRLLPFGLVWLASCAELDPAERARLITQHREEGVRLVGQAKGVRPQDDLPILMEALEHLDKANELAIRPYSACPKCRAAYANCLTAIGLSHLQISIEARDEAKRLRAKGDDREAIRQEETRDRERAESVQFLRQANEQYRLYERQDYPSWPLPEIFLSLSANYEILEDYKNSLDYMRRFLGEAERFVRADVKERCLRKIEELEEIVRRQEEKEGEAEGAPPPAGTARRT